MIETDDTGQKQLSELLKNVHCGEFNEYEQRFIKDAARIKYAKLTKNQKAMVTKLFGWLNGEKRR